jgi:hypothetical protein
MSQWYAWCEPCTYFASRLTLSPSELPLDPHHLGVPSGAPKMISKPIARSMQTVHLSCVEISTISKWTKVSFHLTHIRYEFHRVWPKRFLCPWCIRHIPCRYMMLRLTLSPSRLKASFHLTTSPRSSIGRAKMIFEPIGRSVQPMHLSCFKINTISKWTEMSFYLTQIM